jgi:hypothetical protein
MIGLGSLIVWALTGKFPKEAKMTRCTHCNGTYDLAAGACPTCQPSKDSTAEILKLMRQATARIVTCVLEATAEAADMERTVIFRRDQMCPPGLAPNPQLIRDLVQSPAYTELVEKYVAGDIRDHLLTHVINLLRLRLPGVIA